MWEQTYWYSGEIDDDLLNKVTRSYRRYHANKLGVPISEIHALWNSDDYRDPMSNSIVFGWRSDWKEDCKNKCNFHNDAQP
jgi:hypothetical protein